MKLAVSWGASAWKVAMAWINWATAGLASGAAVGPLETDWGAEPLDDVLPAAPLADAVAAAG